MKKAHIAIGGYLLAALLTIQLAACTAKISISAVQTSVAETVAAVPAQPEQEVTKLVEVTRVVAVSAPAPTKAEATRTPTATASPSPTQEQTQPTALQATDTPTAGIQPGTPLYWSLQYFVQRYSYMTNLQRKEFAASLPGKTVSWYAILENTTYEGLIIMRYPFGMEGFIILQDVASETAVLINRGYQVEFSGMIESFNIETNYLTLKNVKIIAFYVEPTATITPTPTPVTPTPAGNH
jgi:hypothetical protein